MLYYSSTDRERLLEGLPSRFDAYISRIDPGHVPGIGALYFEMLYELCNLGMVGMPYPDVMLAFGAKAAFVKLQETPLIPSDTFVSYKMEVFRPQWAKTLMTVSSTSVVTKA